LTLETLKLMAWWHLPVRKRRLLSTTAWHQPPHGINHRMASTTAWHQPPHGINHRMALTTAWH